MSVHLGPDSAQVPKSSLTLWRIGAGIDSFGSGLSAGCVVLYFVTFVGFSPASVALGLGIGAALGTLLPFMVGGLADRFPTNKIYMIALCARGIGMLLYAASTDYTVFIIGSIIGIAFEHTTFPLQQALISASVPSSRRLRFVSSIRGIRNAAIGTGTAVAGLLITTQNPALIRTLLLVNCGSFILLGILVYFVTKNLRFAPGPGQGEGATRPAVRNPTFMALTLANAVVALHDSVLVFLMPLWVVLVLGLSPALPGLLLSFSTVVGVLFQIWVVRWRPNLQPAAALLAAAISLIAGLLLAAVTTELPQPLSVAGCVATLVGLAVGENFFATGSWELVLPLSPPERRSEYLNVFNAGFGLQGVAGPGIAAFVLSVGASGWLLLAGVIGGGALFFHRFGGQALQDANRAIR